MSSRVSQAHLEPINAALQTWEEAIYARMHALVVVQVEEIQ